MAKLRVRPLTRSVHGREKARSLWPSLQAENRLGRPHDHTTGIAATADSVSTCPPIPVAVVDLIPRLREAFPDGLPGLGSAGLLPGKAPR